MTSTGSLLPTGIAPYREYHAQRARERLERREVRRQRFLEAVRAGVSQLAPTFAAIRSVWLFGSLLRPGGFSRRSDIDLAIDCDAPVVEGQFRRALADALRASAEQAESGWPEIDLRPLEGGVAWAVEVDGECVYARKVSGR